MVVLALLVGSTQFMVGMSPSVAQGNESESFSPELVRQLAEIYQQKQALTPAQRKIDSGIINVVREVKKRISAAAAGKTPRFRDLSTFLLKIDYIGNIEVKLTVKNKQAAAVFSSI